MSSEYLDIDSSYRNRNLWPIPGQFEIPISQTGDKGKGYALDPVCLSEPVAVWSCNGLTTSQPTTFQLYGVISPPQIYGNVGYSQTGTTLTIVFTDEYNNSVQTKEDYYVGMVIWILTQTEFSRITSYTYIGNDGSIPSNYSQALITVSDAITFAFGNTFVITDPSDLSNSNYPLLFVPNGKTEDNGYLNYILYCETNNDYRAVTLYDSIYKYISCKPWTNISNPTFQQYGNFCIRKEPPVFPEQLEPSQFVSTDSTNSSVKVTISGSCSLSQITDFYKYDFLRIRPYRTPINPVTVVIGGQNLSGDTGDIMAYGVNGINWTENSNPLNQEINSIINNGPNSSSLLWVATGASNPFTKTYVYSTDGETWTLPVSSNPFGNNTGLGSFYFNNLWFIGAAILTLPNATKTFAITSDPISGPWTNDCNPLGTPFASSGNGSGGVVYGINVTVDNTNSNLYRIIVVGYNATNSSIKRISYGIFNPSLLTLTWGQPTTDPFSGGVGIGVSSNSYISIAVGYNSTRTVCIAVSYDSGTSWTNSIDNPFSGGECRGVSWNGSYWVAVGYNSNLTVTAARSEDGLNWVSSVTNPFGGIGTGINVAWVGSYWVAVGGPTTNNIQTTPVVATSPDGSTWTVNSTYSNLFIGRTISVYNSNTFENIGIYNQNLTSQSRQIISYTNDAATAIFNVYPPFSGTDLFTTVNSYTIEVEAFSYDNFNPFTYTGTLVQQQSCYEFELINLILPNFTLSSGEGSKIAFYPYVYVILSNVSSAGSHLKNILSSNNPNAVKVIFKVPIYDVQDPITTPFVRLVSGNMIQTIKFKPNDNLFFSVLLPNGDIFNTLLPEAYSPEIPTAKSQVSATFRFRRI